MQTPPGTRSEYPALWALLFGNFVIGAGVLAPAGLINQLSAAFGLSAPAVGSLIGYGAAVLCVEAPLLAFVTNRVDRRALLAGSMVLYAAGHLASAFASGFAALLAIRLVMIASAAVFTPQAAAVVGLFVKPERRASAVAFVFMGWSLATAFGVPAISLMGAHAGWSTAYLMLALASALAAAATGLTIPRGLKGPQLSLEAWGNVFSSGKILLILSVTAISLAGQFTVYPFVASELKGSFDASPELIAGVLALYGIAGILGAAVVTAAIDKLGAPTIVSACLVTIIIALAMWSAGTTTVVLAAASIFVWGLGFGPANSSQQARLIAADPTAASASVALNTSAIYVGQASGTVLGGRMLTFGHAHALGFVGAMLVGAALLASLTARLRFRA